MSIFYNYDAMTQRAIYRRKEAEKKTFQDGKLIKTDKNGTRTYESNRCPKCSGSGDYPSMLDDGICWKCSGSGYYWHTWKEYTPEYRAILDARAAARREKQRLDGQAEWLEKFGFTPDGECWIILGNTYSIKDALKANGCKFNPVLGWYSREEMPGYPCEKFCLFDFIEVAERDCYHTRAVVKAVEAIKNPPKNEATPANVSSWQGEVKQRRDWTLKLMRSVDFDVPSFSGFGMDSMTIYIMQDEAGNIFTWKTSGCMMWKKMEGTELAFAHEGDTVTLAGTVKAHEDYKGTKQTALTRCTVKEIKRDE